MRFSIILPTLLVAAAAIGVAACGSNDESAASRAGSSAGIVSVASVDGSDVLADAAGMTLYTAAVEKGGKIRCVDGCTSFWKPLQASPTEARTAAGELDLKLTVVKRPDGEQQLALDGQPLYTFAEEKAGALKGDGFVDDFQGTQFEWQAARTGGGGGAPSDDRSGGGYGY